MPADDTGSPLDPADLGYADAVAELEEILHQLDGDEIDVDHLGDQVRRAAELIAVCRDRLGAARVEVTRIVADLDLVAAPADDLADDDLDEDDDLVEDDDVAEDDGG